MAEPAKDTIYIDVDEEITGIIEKVQNSPQKIVALVLPKRAAVLQSVVNMKLLKKAGEGAKKQVVLITSEAGLLPLAGAVGLYTAKTLQSKPEVPAKPEMPDTSETVIDAAAEEAPETEVPSEAAEDEPVDTTKSVGELAHLPAGEPEETIEVDNDETPAIAAGAAKKVKGNKKLRVPNFNKFRLWFFLGGVVLILLIVGWIMAFMVLPKANITIKTDGTSINSSQNITLDTAAKTLDTAKLIVPAKQEQTKKTDTQKVPATGQKDQGTKASGTAILSNCSKTSSSAVTIPAGTGVSSGNLTFITQKTVNLDSPNFDGLGNCKASGSHVGTTGVTAQQNGDQYNLTARSYTVAGFSGVTAQGSDMTGGVSKLVKIVSAQDIETAKGKFPTQNATAATDDLKKTFLAEKLQAIAETVVASDPAIATSPNVGDEADQVTVTSTITYTMLGVKTDDLKTLVEADVKKQIDTKQQNISDNGVSKATFKLLDNPSAAQTRVTVQATAKTGAILNPDDLKKQIAGKKKGETQTLLSSHEGVKEVNIKYSPFWVFSTPKKLKNVTITIEPIKSNGS